MSFKRKGQLTSYGGWEKHLRKFAKRIFWKGERFEEKRMVDEEISETDDSAINNRK